MARIRQPGKPFSTPLWGRSRGGAQGTEATEERAASRDATTAALGEDATVQSLGTATTHDPNRTIPELTFGASPVSPLQAIAEGPSVSASVTDTSEVGQGQDRAPRYRIVGILGKGGMG